MEQIHFGGRRVVGFGDIFDDAARWWSSETTPNPAYQETAKITGQETDPSAPPDAPATPTIQQACANVPESLQAITGCSNANTKLKPGESATTAPASVLTLPFGGGVDANGKSILSPTEWLAAHKTAIILTAIGIGTIVVGAVTAPIVMEAMATRRMERLVRRVEPEPEPV
jgi:hypothetical protein